MGRPRKQPSISDQLSSLDDEIPALEVAIRLQEQRVKAAEARLAAPSQDLALAVLEIGAAEYESSFADARQSLTELAPIFARLIAADQVRLHFLGDRFPIPTGAKPPFGGLSAVRAILKAFPENMRPPELAERLLLARAQDISSACIAEIKGVNS